MSLRRIAATVVLGLCSSFTVAMSATTPASAETVLFFDDFNGTSIDTTKWVPGLHQWGGANNGVVPENLSVRTVDDNGTNISVLRAQANGNQYTGSIRGVKSTDASYPIGDPARYTRQSTGQLTGGLVWTKNRFGAGRYEVRMKNLPQPGGCSCIWNYYEPGGSDYTEIDIEMPANGTASRSDWSRWAGLNSYTGPDDAHATYQNVDLGFNNNDGNFHTYRWDWYDGTNGAKRIEYYVDGVLRATQTATIPVSAAQLWVGNWPASWSGNFNYATQYQYIDWVKISTLGGGGSDTQAPTAPTGLTSTGRTSTSIDLAWNASTDNVGVTGYDVYQGSTKLTSVTGTTATVSGLTPNTAYTLTVRAHDAANNTSAASNAVTVTTDASGGGTNKVVNGDFEGATLSPWNCVGTTAKIAGQGVGGSAAVRLTPTQSTTARCQQTVSGLTPGQTYTLKGQLHGDGSNYIYLGQTVNGVTTERGGNLASYTAVTVPSFTAPASGTVTIYVSAWRQQTGATFADNVTLS
ncbi:fibronectin type III domain-containing protein [Acrocarpospora catenulata]|uniref:fibronectin type III domain-containing protein n=1 Tax=Acrocarpospora catenulata TaxID=2836182 RepID=UPI0027E190A7|nr:fibronectin type III domain-containing protein [Acrocarpospora catenulata]